MPAAWLSIISSGRMIRLWLRVRLLARVAVAAVVAVAVAAVARAPSDMVTSVELAEGPNACADSVGLPLSGGWAHLRTTVDPTPKTDGMGGGKGNGDMVDPGPQSYGVRILPSTAWR